MVVLKQAGAECLAPPELPAFHWPVGDSSSAIYIFLCGREVFVITILILYFLR